MAIGAAVVVFRMQQLLDNQSVRAKGRKIEPDAILKIIFACYMAAVLADAIRERDWGIGRGVVGWGIKSQSRRLHHMPANRPHGKGKLARFLLECSSKIRGVMPKA